LKIEQDPRGSAVAEEQVGRTEGDVWIITADPEDAAKEGFRPRDGVKRASSIDPRANPARVKAGLEELFENKGGSA